MIKSFNGKTPKIGKNVYIAETAVLIGDVTLGDDVSVWDSAVLRADWNSITVGRGSNIQDNATVHVTDKCPVSIGEDCTVAHNAVLHGCTLKDGAFVGMGAIVMNDTVLGENAFVAAGALVTERKNIEPRSCLMGLPAKNLGPILTDEDVENTLNNARSYVRYKNMYLAEAKK